MSIEKNKVNLGVCNFPNPLPNKPLFAAIELYDVNSSISLIDDSLFTGTVVEKVKELAKSINEKEEKEMKEKEEKEKREKEEKEKKEKEILLAKSNKEKEEKDKKEKELLAIKEKEEKAKKEKELMEKEAKRIIDEKEAQEKSKLAGDSIYLWLKAHRFESLYSFIKETIGMTDISEIGYLNDEEVDSLSKSLPNDLQKRRLRKLLEPFLAKKDECTIDKESLLTKYANLLARQSAKNEHELLRCDSLYLWLKVYNFDSIQSLLMKQIGITEIYELDILNENEIGNVLNVFPHQLQKKRFLRQLLSLKDSNYILNNDLLLQNHTKQQVTLVHPEVFEFLKSNGLETNCIFLFEKFGFLEFEDINILLDQKIELEKVLTSDCNVPKIKVRRLLDILIKKNNSLLSSSVFTPPTSPSNEDSRDRASSSLTFPSINSRPSSPSLKKTASNEDTSREGSGPISFPSINSPSSSVIKKSLKVETPRKNESLRIIESPRKVSLEDINKSSGSVTLKGSGATYLLKKVIHSGNHDVYEGVKRGVKMEQCIIKLYKDEDIAAYKREIKFYDTMIKDPISKKYIVEALDWDDNVTCLTKNVHVIILEKGEMDLLQWLNNASRDYKKKELKMFELVSCVKFLHDKGFIHCDLKPSNVGLFEKDKELIVKLIDFDSYREEKEPIGNCQSGEYAAPEIWEHIKNGRKKTLHVSFSLDIWSLGMIFARMFQKDSKFELMLSQNTEVFESSPDIIDSVISLSFKRELLHRVKDANKKLFELMDKYMLVKDDIRDSSISQLYEHGYFKYDSVSSLAGGLNRLGNQIDEVKHVVKDEAAKIIDKVDAIREVQNLMKTDISKALGSISSMDESMKATVVGQVEIQNQLRLILSKGDENAESIKTFMQKEIQNVNDNLSNLAKKVASKEDLNLLQSAMDKNIKTTSDQLNSISSNMIKAANEQQLFSFDLQENMKGVLTSLQENIKEVKSVKSDVTNYTKSVSESVEMFKAFIDVNNTDISTLLKSLCSSVNVNSDIQKEVLGKLDQVKNSLDEVKEIQKRILENQNELMERIELEAGKVREEIMNGNKETLSQLHEILLKGEEQADSIKEFLKNESEIVQKSLSVLSSKVVKKEDLQSYIKEALDISMKGTLSQLDSMEEKIMSIANHQESVSLDMKESMKGVLESLNVNLKEIGSAKSEVKTAIKSITASVDAYKGHVDIGIDNRYGMSEIKTLLNSLCSNINADKEIQKKILARVDNINETMTKVSEKVDTLQLMNLEILGELKVPRLALMLESKGRESTSTFGKIKNTALKMTDYAKLTQSLRLHLLCEGWSDGPCTEVHKGYQFDAPGETLVKVAPIIILTCKVLGPAIKLGVKCAGLPLPDVLGSLGDSLKNFSSMITDPLDGKSLEMFNSLYGDKYTSDGNTDPATMSDLVNYMASDVSDRTESVEKKSEEMKGYQELASSKKNQMLGESYKQFKEMLENKTTWMADKEKFYLQKYIKQDTSKDSKIEIKWLCEKHCKTLNANIGLKDPSSKVQWKRYESVFNK